MSYLLHQDRSGGRRWGLRLRRRGPGIPFHLDRHVGGRGAGRRGRGRVQQSLPLPRHHRLHSDCRRRGRGAEGRHVLDEVPLHVGLGLGLAAKALAAEGARLGQHATPKGESPAYFVSSILSGREQ